MIRPILEVAEDLGLDAATVLPWGRHRAKVDLAALRPPETAMRGKLVLVSATTPTPAGEGKTTTSIALAMGLRRLGRRAVATLREPSLGPVFGIKGGGTGGGKAQLMPADDINLHFTGDLHAVGSAHNLLSALVDNELHFGSEQTGLDPRRTTFRRVVDMNDRALRQVVIGLGGRLGGLPRETGFDITAASEVMAILCLADSPDDLRARLARVVVGQRRDGTDVSAHDLEAEGAMTALLRDALMPNLAQTSEGGPALVHGGPFANIAHGCSSVLSTRLALQTSDIAVTEGGFGFDLGAEKYLDIKARDAGLFPDALVLVTTQRALRFHGGLTKREAGSPNPAALQRGLANLRHHLRTATETFFLPVVVAVNAFPTDSEEENRQIMATCAELGVEARLSRGYSDGGAGTVELAEAVLEALAQQPKPSPRYAYDLASSYEAKLEALAAKVYGADGVHISDAARRELRRIEAAGQVGLPVCVAKTHLSISDDARLRGRPTGFRMGVREVRLSAGAGFLVCLLGPTLTMPGLPRAPAAGRVRLEADGRIRGLMQNE